MNGSEHNPAWRPGRVFAALVFGSGATALVGALCNVAWMAATSEVAILRNLELWVIVLGDPGRPRWAWAGRWLANNWTMVLNHVFALRTPGALIEFAGLAMLVSLAMSLTFVVLLSPPVLLAARLSAALLPPRVATVCWARIYPSGIIAAAAVPTLAAPIHQLLHGAGFSVIAATAAALALVLWFSLFLVLRSTGRAATLASTCRKTTVILTVASLTAVTAVIAEGDIVGDQPQAVGGAPNILLVSIDSLRADHVHAYGYARDTTPTLDALARDGVLFRTVVAASSWTLPTHLTMLTSLPPERHGVVADGLRLRRDVLFLPQVLHRTGYETAGVVSAPYLDAAYGFSQGFDHYDDYTIAKQSFDASQESVTSPELLQLVTHWLDDWDRRGRTRPFFLFVHMWDVHYDYTPPPPYDSMFDPDYRGTVTGKNYEFGTEVHLGMPERDLQHVVALYDGEIRFTDLYLGRLIDRLRDLGVVDHTIIVVTADHGDEFFEHGQKGHKKQLYDESILVPLIVRYPAKLPAGRVVDAQVRQMDIAPTILSLAQVARPAQFGGAVAGSDAPQDLTAWVTRPDVELPPLDAFSDLVGDAPVPVASIRTQTHKLIREVAGPYNEELYDLSVDPGERHNLRGGDIQLAAPLREQLLSWRAQFSGAPPLAEAVALSREHKERLKALGYTQ